jgi:plasmid stabilization system protein ParE
VTRSIRILRSASQELEEATHWYEKQRRGLCRDLFRAVYSAVESIAVHPRKGDPALDAPEFRRVLVARFPYQVVYRVDAKEIVIVAFAHLRRRPGFWKHRR